MPENVTIGGAAPSATVPWAYNLDPPQIVAVWLSEAAFNSGDRACASVVTSSNAVSVEARIESYGRSLERSGVGTFHGCLDVPSVPPFLRRGFTLQFVARNERRQATVERVPISVR